MGASLRGLRIVLTGTLDCMTRSEAKARIAALGGEVPSTLSRRTSFVVVGENPGSKVQRAHDLGVPTLSEAQFLSLLEGHVPPRAA